MHLNIFFLNQGHGKSILVSVPEASRQAEVSVAFPGGCRTWKLYGGHHKAAGLSSVIRLAARSRAHRFVLFCLDTTSEQGHFH